MKLQVLILSIDFGGKKPRLGLLGKEPVKTGTCNVFKDIFYIKLCFRDSIPYIVIL